MAVLKANGSILKANGKVLVRRSTPIIEQEWTSYNVPAGLQTLHDFGDGAGPVPAIPVDNAGIRNEIVKVNAYELHNDNAGIRNEIVKVNAYELHNDNAGIRNEIVNVLEVN